MLLQCKMGCGRSKADSSTASTKDEKDNIISSSKHHKSHDNKKENVAPKKRKDSGHVKAGGEKKNNESKYSEKSPSPRKLTPQNVNGSALQNCDSTQDGENQEDTGLSPSKTGFRDKPPPPPTTMQQTKMSNSQLEFFKMLDEKIEKGRDYSFGEDSLHN